MSFQASLHYGQVGESLIAQWLKTRAYSVLPIYEVEVETGKGPRLFTPGRSFIAPDMLAFTADRTLWIEAKHKTAFSWYRKTQEWVTGVDLRHYHDYCQVDDTSPFPVWVLFLQRGGHAKNSPSESPSGLYGNALSFLRTHEHHRSDRWGPSGMVYWSLDALKQLEELKNIVCLEKCGDE